MRKVLLILSLAIFLPVFGQSDTDKLKTEIEEIKTEVKQVKSDVQSVKTENIALKKSLDINKAILEQEADGSVYKITKVEGDKAKKLITVTFLVESKNQNKKVELDELSIIDLEGNEYKVDFFKSSSPYANLALNVPLKLYFGFKDVSGEPQFVKLFRFRSLNKPEGEIHATRSKLEFRDFKVDWK